MNKEAKDWEKIPMKRISEEQLVSRTYFLTPAPQLRKDKQHNKN